MRKGSDMIQVLAISGSPVKDGNTEALVKEALGVLANEREVQTEIFNLSTMKIEGCRHCNWCVRNQTSERHCALSDGMDPIYPALLKADVILLATPVHIGRMSGLMANTIDRLRGFVYGNLYGGRLKDKVGAALIVAFLRHGGLEETLSLLNSSFALFHMIAVGRGGLALTSLEGKGKVAKGVRHMVLEDSLGLSSAREVVQRSVELARIIQAGKKALQYRV